MKQLVSNVPTVGEGRGGEARLQFCQLKESVEV